MIQILIWTDRSPPQGTDPNTEHTTLNKHQRRIDVRKKDGCFSPLPVLQLMVLIKEQTPGVTLTNPRQTRD